jgi:hypothetical protein
VSTPYDVNDGQPDDGHDLAADHPVGRCSTRNGRDCVNRREVVRVSLSGIALALLSGCALLPAAGSRPNASVRIGLLSARGLADIDSLVNALVQRLGELGWADGNNIVLDLRGANGDRAALPALTDELVNLPVNIIVTDGTAPVQVARQATSSIPQDVAVQVTEWL